jgi:hypothetical protein
MAHLHDTADEFLLHCIGIIVAGVGLDCVDSQSLYGLCDKLRMERDQLKQQVVRLQEIIAAARSRLDEIAVTEGDDSGVIWLSPESPTHYQGDLCVYDHEHFSELGDALVELANILKGA